jgi:hypothetical protein
VEEECLDNNPALKMYRSISNDMDKQPTKEVAGGLLSRSGGKKASSVGKPNPKTDVADRVARYVNDIRNYNA